MDVTSSVPFVFRFSFFWTTLNIFGQLFHPSFVIPSRAEIKITLVIQKKKRKKLINVYNNNIFKFVDKLLGQSLFHGNYRQKIEIGKP